MTPEETAGQSTRARRLALAVTQTDLAARMTARGYPWRQSTVWKLEDGRRPLRIGEAVALAEVLGTTLQELLGLRPRPPAAADLAVRAATVEAAARRVGDLAENLRREAQHAGNAEPFGPVSPR